jgi:hypothetical protein
MLPCLLILDCAVQPSKDCTNKAPRDQREKRETVRSFRAAALSALVEAGEEDILEDDGEEEREVSIQLLEGVYPNLS